MVIQDKSLKQLSQRVVLDAEGKKIGRIKDAIVDKKNLDLIGFVIHGSKWEEMMEGLGIKKDVDPLVSNDLITNVDDSSIILNKSKRDLPNAMVSGTLTEDKILFSDIRKVPLQENSGKDIGIFTDIYFNNIGEASYKIGGKDFLIFLKNHYFSENLTYVVSPTKVSFTEGKYILKGELKDIEKNLKISMTNVVRDLMKEALKDGKITNEEEKLINSISVSLSDYYDALSGALDDKIITKDEEKVLDILKEKMIKEVHSISLEDEVLSADERAIIKKFAGFIVERRKELFWSVYGTFH